VAHGREEKWSHEFRQRDKCNLCPVRLVRFFDTSELESGRF
jgi:hypothetical protein